MPRFYCDYCDAYLTHDSMSGRQQHMRGWKHRENFKLYYQTYFPQWMMEQQARQMHNPQQYPGMMPGMMPGYMPGYPGAEGFPEQAQQQMPPAPFLPGAAMGLPPMPGQPPVFRAPPSMAPPPPQQQHTMG